MTEAQIKIDTENVLAREVEGEIVILDLTTQRYIGGNRSVTVLWPLLEAGASREQLITALIEKFSIERAEADRDIAAFLDSLEEFGLLADTTPSAPAADPAA